MSMFSRIGFHGYAPIGAAALCVVASMLNAERVQAKPSIILFISDDHGWLDSGAYGDTFVRTPNIDRLAKEGMRFTHAFAASPLCSPSRCVIQTGLMPHRNGGHKFGTPIRNDLRTMPTYLKELGYYTAHFGKFHHGPGRSFPYDHIRKSEEEAADFLADFNGPGPLFMVVCTHPPHTPWTKNTTYDPDTITLPPNLIDTPETRADRADYYSDVTLMDNILGDVLDVVAGKAISRNTLFLYSSDQGANWPFAKWCLYDGGLRVPLIARWPGRIAPESRTDAMVNLADLLPTCIAAAGGSVPKDIDGQSFLPVLTGNITTHHAVVFGSHTGNDNGGPGVWNHCPARTIRTPTHRYILNLSPDTTFTTHITGVKQGIHFLPHWDSWVKKAKTDPIAKATVERYQHRPREELYDMGKDPFEMVNLADSPEHAELLKSLRTQLATWCKRQGDTIPLEYLAE
ncbi:MAG: sulfatase [Fuerstiella sp.]|nr:sulfatase [Fuerstiella sp.]MCP4858539.1 sulfatase [Fuerstiella sp.]